MRVDYKKFPDIPPHCQLNAKPNRPGEFQVFRENRVLDPATGKKKTVRETIGIIKNDQFTFSALWLERQEHLKLLEEVEQLRKVDGNDGLGLGFPRERKNVLFLPCPQDYKPKSQVFCEFD